MYEKIINDTLSSVFEKKSALIKTLFIYLLVMIFVDYMNANNMIIIDGKAEIKSGFILFITTVLSYIVFLMTAITIHRVLILSENSIPKWGLFKLSKREWSFIYNGIIMGLIVMAIIIPIVIIGVSIDAKKAIIPIAVLIVLIMSILISRYSLVFPAIAIDKNMRLSEAWKFTKEYKLLVFVTVIIFPALFSLIFGFVYGIAIDFLSKLTGFNLLFLNSVLNIVITVFTISALSATYRLIANEHPEFFEEQKEETIKELRDTKIESLDNNHKIVIHDQMGIIFEELIDKLKLQYFKLGFTNIVIDKESTWMIKDPLNENSYVLLSYIDDEYIIEIYQGDMIDFVDQLKIEEENNSESKTIVS